jgi:hypothetical protein
MPPICVGGLVTDPQIVAGAATLVLMQSIYARQQPDTNSEAARPEKQATALIREQRRPQMVQAVHDLVERVSKFRNLALRIKTSVQLADLLWSSGDGPYARQLLTDLNDQLDAAPVAQAGAKDGADDKLSAEARRGLRTQLMLSVNRHDPAWAKTLVENSAPVPREEAVRINKEGTALIDKLLGRGTAGASVSAQQGLGDSLTGKQNLLSLLSFLGALRKKRAFRRK